MQVISINGIDQRTRELRGNNFSPMSEWNTRSMMSFFPNMDRHNRPHEPVRDWRMRIAFPPVNIAKEDEAFVVTLAMPGYDKEHISIEAREGNLVIRAERRQSSEEHTSTFVHREFDLHSFERSVALPVDTVEEDIAATYAQGVLTVTVPRRADATEVKGVAVPVT